MPTTRAARVVVGALVTTGPAYGLLAPEPWIWQAAAAGGVGGGGGGGVMPAQGAGAASELRGAGVPVVKSVALSFVSLQPPLARRSAVVDDGAGAGRPSA